MPITKIPQTGGGGGGSGTVTSVGLALPSFITVSGTPVTGAGTLTGTLASQSANAVFAGPASGAAAAPTFRALVSADIPNIMSDKFSDMFLDLTSGTVATMNPAASGTSPAKGRIGSNTYRFSAPSTATISSGSGTGAVFFYQGSNGALFAGHDIGGLVLTGSGLTAVNSGVTQYPSNSIPLWTAQIAGGAWASKDDYRAFISKGVNFSQGQNVQLTQTGTGLTIAVPLTGVGDTELLFGTAGDIDSDPALTYDATNNNLQNLGEVIAGANSRLTIGEISGNGAILFKDAFSNNGVIGIDAFLYPGFTCMYIGQNSAFPNIEFPGPGGWKYPANRILTVATLPTPGAVELLRALAVSDATVATPGTVVAGGGTFTVMVRCILDSAGPTYSWRIV